MGQFQFVWCSGGSIVAITPPDLSYSFFCTRFATFVASLSFCYQQKLLQLGLPTVPELTHGVPCPGRGSFCPGNVKINHRAWIYGCSLMSVFVSHTRLDLSVMSLTDEIVIIRLAANTINNDEMQQA